jgi:hypothetical protein
MSAWAAIGSAVASLAGPITQAFVSRKNTKDTIAAGKDAANLEWERNLEMWNMQNEYNSPAAQMERYKEAGLNPALIYGSGGGSSGNASAMPKYQAYRPDYSGRQSAWANAMSSVLPAISAFQDMKMKSAQIDNVKQQTDLTRLKAATEIANESLKTRQAGTELYKRGVMHQKQQLGQEMSKYYSEYAKASMERIIQDLRNKRTAADLREADLEWYKWMKGTGSVGNLAPLLRMFTK